MKKIALLNILLCLAVAPVAGNASTSNASRITSIVQINGVLFFNTDTLRSDSPACVSAHLRSRWAVSTATSAGQSYVAQIFLAYSLQKRIVVGGNGQCNVWGDTETAETIQMLDD